MSSLKDIQKWVHGVITNPNSVIDGANSAFMGDHKASIETVIAPSKTLSGEQRIDIYRSSYFIRLIDCFKAEYPGLMNAFGEELFTHLAWCYLQEHPSTSYTLHDLGKKFPEYLATTLEENVGDRQPDWWQVFILDMATYERTCVEVYSGEGHEYIPTNDIFGIEPPKVSPSLRTLKLDFPISECIHRFRENEDVEFPDPKTSYHVITRQNYRVKVFLVDEEEWEALHDWIKNPEQECPQKYLRSWRMRGIVYS